MNNQPLWCGTILVITYQSGDTTYIHKDETAIDFIIGNFEFIEEIMSVECAHRIAELEPDASNVNTTGIPQAFHNLLSEDK